MLLIVACHLSRVAETNSTAVVAATLPYPRNEPIRTRTDEQYLTEKRVDKIIKINVIEQSINNSQLNFE